MVFTALLLALATISPSTTVHLVSGVDDQPVHSARLLDIDQRLAELPTSWSTGSKVMAIVGFSLAGVALAVTPILGVSSFVGLFFAVGLAAIAGVAIIVAIVACIVGASGLARVNEEREQLQLERSALVPPGLGGALAPYNGHVLARF